MEEQGRASVSEPLEQGPVEDAGSGSDPEGLERGEVVEATAVEDVAAEVAEPSSEASSDQVSPEQAEPGAAPSPEEPRHADEAQPGADPRGAEGGQEDVEAEETPLQRAERERGEYLELAQRTRAELENFRKRAAVQAADAELRGKAALAKRLVPAMDNLERALIAAGVDPSEESGSEDGAEDALAKGVALVYRELREAMGGVGVESFDPRGERFDPNQHEAIATQPSEDAESGQVIETLDRGWRIGAQVLRPARVVVAG